MALRIYIVKDVSIPYWEQEGTIRLGGVNPIEWGCLLWKEFNRKNVFEYTSEGGDRQAYDDYYSKQILLLREKYPLIVRINDYYEDAFYSKDEIEGFIDEISALKEVVKHDESIRLLDQLMKACELALQNNAGIVFFAD